MTSLWTFEALGTGWEIATHLPLPPPATAAVTDLLDDLDRTWSRFREDSVVTELARHGGTMRLTPAAERLLDVYDQIGDLTGGAVSPLVGGSLAALGYDAQYSLQVGTPAASPAADVMHRDADGLTLRSPATLDIGAAGKGWAVDLVAALLDEFDPGLRWVDASGDLWCHGGADDTERPLRVALEDPADATRAIGVVSLPPGRAIAASAVNRRAWHDVHHVLDARTGEPVRSVIATWAIADSTLVADAAATAAFFAAPADVARALAPSSAEHAPVGVVQMDAHRRIVLSDDAIPDLEVFRC